MKKMLPLLGVLAAGALCSCSSDEPAGANRTSENVIKVVTDVQPISRAGHATETLKEFGLTISGAEATLYANKKLTGDAIGGWNTDETMYWDDQEAAHTIIAYAPYIDGTLDDKSVIDVKVLEDQTTEEAVMASDFIAMKKVGFVPATGLVNGNLPVSMAHMLAKVYLEITYPDAYKKEGVNPVTNVAVNGMLTAAKFDFGAFDGTNSTLALNANATPTAIKPLATSHANTTATYEFIAIPQTQSSVGVSFKIADTPYVWDYSGLNLEGGKAYTIKLNITSTGVNLGGDVNVGDWEDGEEIGGSATEKPEPFTVTDINDRTAWQVLWGTCQFPGYGTFSNLFDNNLESSWFSHYNEGEKDGDWVMSYTAGDALAIIDMQEANWLAGFGFRTGYPDVIPQRVELYVTTDAVDTNVITDEERNKMNNGFDFVRDKDAYLAFVDKVNQAQAAYDWKLVGAIDCEFDFVQNIKTLDLTEKELAKKLAGRYLKLVVKYYPHSVNDMGRAGLRELFVKKVSKQDGKPVVL